MEGQLIKGITIMRKHRTRNRTALTGYDAWRSAMMIWETSIAAPQVIAQRMARFS
jgi:hypothetical protein